MQKHHSLPPSPRARRLFRRIGRKPDAWTTLAYTFRYGMRAAKFTAVINCIKAIRQDGQMPLP
jgi:hypothetical protein